MKMIFLSRIQANDSDKQLKVIDQLCDLLESYEYCNENIEGIEDILTFLLEKLKTDLDDTIKSKKTEVMVLVFMYQKITDYTLDLTGLDIDNLGNYALSNLLEVIGYSKQTNSLFLLEKYKNHSNALVREAAYMAISEINI
ncbi:hypothetical protein LC087_17740 [Bacillus carboniphilus]|uniref:Immunity protein 30 domain-containing protein n=1 Tax=Bacillus carboniphilus TaxID=86663 RepID=A0ABY9JVR1_9BACI|nr:hypothetical protein [Bacillus carboniphilus]WLR42510.1 hypothetical protein LC087_17740 [Bacillus carboniphilus]